MAVLEWINDSGYRIRVYILTALMVLLVVASAYFTYNVSNTSKELIEGGLLADFEAWWAVQSLGDRLPLMQDNLEKLFYLPRDKAKEAGEKYREDKEDISKALLADIEEFEKTLSGLEEQLSELDLDTWTKLEKGFNDYREVELDAGNETMSTEPYEVLSRLIMDAEQLVRKQMKERKIDIEGLRTKTLQVVIFGVMVSLMMAALLSFLLIRSITRPIDLLRKGTQKIAEGEFTHRVDLANRDELGELANAFNEMASQLNMLGAMKDEFIALVSHELKTPLTSMKEAVGLLLEEAVGPVSPKQKRLLRINADGIEKLNLFVEDMLNLTRMEGGMMPLYCTRFDVKEVVQEKLDTFRLLADKKQIHLSAVYKPDPLPHIYGDAERIKQVFSNLLNNAIFFTPHGGEVSFEVEYTNSRSLPARAKEATKLESSKQWLKIKISDTGEGIPKEEWNRVFDKFYQIQKNPHRGGGSGLGLTIAKHIVEAHRGSIWVEESSAEGTTFVMVLPQGEATKPKSTHEELGMSGLQPQNP